MQQNQVTSSTVLLNGDQAKSELTKIEEKVKSLRKELKEAQNMGDLEGVKKFNKQLKETQREMRAMKKDAFDAKKVLDDLSGSSLADLYAAQKKIDALLRNGSVKRNTKEWNELVDAQKKIKGEIADINKEMSVGESRVSKMANGFNKYFAGITAFVAGLTGLTFALKKFMDLRNEKEESQANLKALTGLDDQSIEWLTNQANILSTTMTESGIRIRKSSKEILDAFTVVGSAKPELLKNKDALKEVTEQAMILAEASKMDLNEAVRGLTIAMNMYGASALEASRYTNVLGAGAKEGAAEVDSQTQAILKAGVAASQAGIPIEQLVGAIQTLAEKGIKDEIAGTGLKTFFIKLQSGADDTNPKIVGLQKALENLAAKNLSATEIQEKFGLETFTVASAMISAADKVNFYTKAVTGTNIALEQAKINSETTAAKLAQAKNEFNEAGMKLVENLNPALIKATNLTTTFIKSLSKIVGGSKSMSDQFSEQSTKVVKLKTDIEPLLIRYDMLISKVNKSTSENNELKKIIEKVSSVMPGAVTAVDKYGNAIAISTTRVREFINAEIARLGVVNKKAIEENKKNLEDVISQIAKTKKKIDEINKTGTYTYEKIDKKTGDYLIFSATPEMVKNVQDQYRQLIQDRLGYEEEIRNLSGATLKKQLEDSVKQQQKLQDESKPKDGDKQLIDGVWCTYKSGKWEPDKITPTSGGDSDPLKKQQDKLEDSYKVQKAVLQNFLNDKLISEEVFYQMSYFNDFDYLTKKIELLKQHKKNTTDAELELSQLHAKYQDDTLKRNEEHLKKQEELRKKVLDMPSYLSDEEDVIIDQEKYTLALRLKILEAFHDKGLRSEEQYLKEVADLFKGNQSEINAYLTKHELEENQSRYDKGIIGRRQYLDNTKQITKTYYDEIFADASDIAESISLISEAAGNVVNNIVEAETLAVENKYAKQLKAARKAGKDTTKLEEKIEDEKLAVKKKYADLQFAITVANIIGNTAQAVMKMLAEGGPIAGPILAGLAGASGLGQIAIANQQRESIKNLWTGGFTDSGGKYDPKGIVHSNEFVANQDATSNYTLRKLFNVIDYAQKTNSVARIDNDTIARALSINQGYASGGFVSNKTIIQQPASQDNSAMSDLIQQSIAVNAALLAEVRKGIVSYSSVSGRYGTVEQTKLYETIIKNASR
jgi:TP901 family phage tail tape measure protein